MTTASIQSRRSGSPTSLYNHVSRVFSKTNVFGRCRRAVPRASTSPQDLRMTLSYGAGEGARSFKAGFPCTRWTHQFPDPEGGRGAPASRRGSTARSGAMPLWFHRGASPSTTPTTSRLDSETEMFLRGHRCLNPQRRKIGYEFSHASAEDRPYAYLYKYKYGASESWCSLSEDVTGERVDPGRGSIRAHALGRRRGRPERSRGEGFMQLLGHVGPARHPAQMERPPGPPGRAKRRDAHVPRRQAGTCPERDGAEASRTSWDAFHQLQPNGNPCLFYRGRRAARRPAPSWFVLDRRGIRPRRKQIAIDQQPGTESLPPHLPFGGWRSATTPSAWFAPVRADFRTCCTCGPVKRREAKGGAAGSGSIWSWGGLRGVLRVIPRRA